MDLIKNTLSEQIYHILRGDILSQTIPLGEKLTLKMLQERFKVSSTPIRDALTRLNEEGLVEYYSNIGVNVISLTSHDLTELYQFMGDLDRLALLYASQNPKQEAIRDRLRENIRQTRVIQEKQLFTPEETEHWIQCSDSFHLIFYDFCDNSRLTLAAKRLRSQLTIFSNAYEQEPQPQINIFAEHEAIFQAYQKENYTQAADLMKEHLLHSLDYALNSVLCTPEKNG